MALHLPKIIYVNSIEEWNVVAQEIVGLSPQVILLTGELGAGKTTLVKYILKSLGSDDEVTSPTFSIVNEYQCGDRIIYHMDLYRLESYDELFNAGIEECFYSGNLCIVEWPQLLEEAELLSGAINIVIKVSDMTREVKISY